MAIGHGTQDLRLAPPPEHLEAGRLVLRRARPEDAAALFETCTSDDDVVRWLPWARHEDVAETRAFLEEADRAWEAGTRFGYTVSLAGDDRPVGFIETAAHDGMLGIGNFFERACQGRGLSTDAFTPLLAWGRRHPELHTAYSICDVACVGGARGLRKIGFVEEEPLPGYRVFPNVDAAPRDCVRFRMPLRPAGP